MKKHIALTLCALFASIAVPDVRADDLDIEAYTKEYFPEEVRAPFNSAFISEYARAKANQTVKQRSKTTLLSEPGAHDLGGGDTAINSVIVKPGADLKNVRQIFVVGGKVGTAIVNK